MGIPIEPRLSATAREKRRRVLRQQSLRKNCRASLRSEYPEILNAYEHHDFSFDTHIIDEITNHYQPIRNDRHYTPRNATLFLAPVDFLRNVRASTSNRPNRDMISRIEEALPQFFSIEFLQNIDVQDNLAQLRRNNETSPQLISSTTRNRIATAILSAEDAVIATQNQEDEQPSNSPNSHSASDDDDDNSNTQASNSSHLCILYTEGSDPVTNPVWKIGTWCNSHLLSAEDVFIILSDAFIIIDRISPCPITKIQISDCFATQSNVVNGIKLVKDLSAERLGSYCSDPHTLQNPITGNIIEVVAREV